jgi:hypothetical protein
MGATVVAQLENKILFKEQPQLIPLNHQKLTTIDHCSESIKPEEHIAARG